MKLTMIRRLTLALFVVALATPAAAQQAPATPAPVVFFDIAGPDQARQQKFYRELFGWKIAPDGSFSVPVTPPLQTLIRPDPADKVFYIGVDDVTATLQRVVANGGTIEVPRLEVPGRVILGMLKDPAGNRVGLVEMKDGKAKVPVRRQTSDQTASSLPLGSRK
jgi:predicted enzyme related to lactoylglutathione lyase